MRVYRASSLGYSLCQLVAPNLGYSPLPTPDFLQSAFDEGRRLEPLIIDKLRATLDCQIDYQGADDGSDEGRKGEEVRIEIIPGRAIIIGHLDGRIKVTSNGPEKILEAKSMNARTWTKFFNNGLDASDKVLGKYLWQVSALMLATQMPLMLVAWNKDTEELARHTITEPPYSISDLARKIYKAEDYIDRGEIPDGCNDWPCPFCFLHPPKEEVEKADKELDYLLEAWLIADKAEKAHKREKDELRAAIVEYVGEEGAGKVKGSQGVMVSTVWQPGKEVSYKTKDAWVTSVSAPRMKKDKDD